MRHAHHLSEEAATSLAEAARLAGELSKETPDPALLALALVDSDKAVHELLGSLKLDLDRIRLALRTDPGVPPGPEPEPGDKQATTIEDVVDNAVQVAWSFGEHRARGLHLLIAAFGTRGADWGSHFKTEELQFEQLVAELVSEIGSTSRGARQRRRLLESYWSENGSTSPMAGTGADVCYSRGFLHTAGAMSCDGVLCFTFLGIPLFALRHVHMFAWNPRPTGRPWVPDPASQVEVPIRPTPEAAPIAIVRRILAIACSAGALIGFLWFFDRGNDAMLAAALQLFLPFPALCVAMGYANRRHARIRCILGDHDMGNSDPVYWLPEYLATLPEPWIWFGTSSYTDAVAKLLADGNVRGAMWAARAATAREDAAAGETATDAVLSDPRAAELIASHGPRWIA